jgi:hypothetical protein
MTFEQLRRKELEALHSLRFEWLPDQLPAHPNDAAELLNRLYQLANRVGQIITRERVKAEDRVRQLEHSHQIPPEATK